MFVDKKSSNTSGLTVICGDFNVNSLPETEDVKRMIISADARNERYLEIASGEYLRMVEILEGGQKGSLTDVII